MHNDRIDELGNNIVRITEEFIDDLYEEELVQPLYPYTEENSPAPITWNPERTRPETEPELQIIPETYSSGFQQAVYSRTFQVSAGVNSNENQISPTVEDIIAADALIISTAQARAERVADRIRRVARGTLTRTPRAPRIIEPEPTPLRDRSNNRQGVWEQMQHSGTHFPYATDVLTYLDIYPEDIPKSAFGIEMEVHTSKAMLDYQIERDKWDKECQAWYEKQDFRKVTECQKLTVHYTDREARTYRDRVGNENTRFITCPACGVRYQEDGRVHIIVPRGSESETYHLISERVANFQKTAPKQPTHPEGWERSRRNFVQSLANSLPLYSFIAKRDGSLDEEMGIELVSRPLRLEDARNWLRILTQRCVEYEACIPSTSYGMHVHVNRKAFMGHAHIMRFFHALNAHAANATLVAFVGKDRAEANAHGDMRRGRGDPWARTYKQGFKRCFATGIWGGDHHDAVSLYPRNTVEVRIFQSTTDSTVACANLEFVVALMEYLRPGSDGGSVIRFNFNSFFRWCLEYRKKDYTFLYERLLMLITQGDLIDPRLSVKEQRVQRRKTKSKKKNMIIDTEHGRRVVPSA